MSTRLLAPLGFAAVLALAAVLRFWALGQPASLVFDELYYVRDAISQLAHGFPTVWPDDDPLMGAAFTDEGSYAVHPPLGKWLIALGLLVFGDETGWGWRSAVALVGVATVGVTMRLAWHLSRNIVVSLLAGCVLAVDGVHVVLTRVALLDGFLTFFVVIGALFMWRDHEWVVARTRFRSGGVLWHRPWLITAAVAFGCAASVKWSGLYPLAGFLLLTAARDAWVRVEVARALRTAKIPAVTMSGQPWWRAFVQALATGLLTLPVTFAVYVASWAGWIVTAGGWGRDAGSWPVALWDYHVSMFDWHSTLSAPHPFQAHPLTWPLGLRPTAMYERSVGEGFTAVISPLPNLLVTWGGVVALVVLAWWIVRPFVRTRVTAGDVQPPGPVAGLASRRRHRVVTQVPFAAVFVLTGYLSGWLPWVLTLSRSAVFQFYAVVLTPFSALALALVLGAICAVTAQGHTSRKFVNDEDLLGRRVAVAIFLAAAVTLAALFFPVWSGMPIADWFWQWHRWLPGWD